jgi:heterodisulfide reductase subunit A
VKVLKKSRYVDETKCTGCGICAQHCPVEVPNEFDEGLGVRKAIYVPFPQAVPLVYTIDKENCLECGLCEKVCGTDAINREQQPEEIEIEVGAIILTTGYDLFDATKKGEYGFGVYDNVILGMMLERLLSASGPTGGHLIRPSDGKIPKSIAFIQCVGSRDEKAGNLYCSRVCCMYATKEALLIKEHVPEADVMIFYMDIRAFGKGFEEFYRRAEKEYNIKYIKGRVAEVLENPDTKNLLIRAENIELGKLFEVEVDLVVLSTGLVPAATETVKRVLPVSVGDDGFFAVNHPKVDPVSTSVEGVFTAGAAEGPKDIPDSVTQASAAAMRTSTILKD